MFWPINRFSNLENPFCELKVSMYPDGVKKVIRRLEGLEL